MNILNSFFTKKEEEQLIKNLEEMKTNLNKEVAATRVADVITMKVVKESNNDYSPMTEYTVTYISKPIDYDIIQKAWVGKERILLDLYDNSSIGIDLQNVVEYVVIPAATEYVLETFLKEPKAKDYKILGGVYDYDTHSILRY